MQLFINGNKRFSWLCSGEESVEILKNFISEEEGVPVNELQLFAAGVPLNDDIVVGSLDCQTIDVCLRLKGGKVHGSLARAGKVKDNTKKVPKQEKKKKKTGRAKRRMQYNRRFVNVVQGFGRRRGPNSNATN